MTEIKTVFERISGLSNIGRIQKSMYSPIFYVQAGRETREIAEEEIPETIQEDFFSMCNEDGILYV